jgi:hypothetical protein
VQRITPFSKPNAIGKYKWYKDFGVSYQLQFENRIETKDSIFFSGLPFESILPGVQFNSPLKLTVGDEFKQGIIHSIPITLGSYKFFKQKFSFTPTVNYREFWYFNSIEKNWNEDSKKIDTTFKAKNWFPNLAFGYDTIPEVRTVVFKNATVWTNEKDGILKDATVITENGKIKYVGTNSTATPTKAIIIDAKGKHLTAGIIDEHSHIAISKGVNEGGQAISAEVNISDVVTADDINIYRQ